MTRSSVLENEVDDPACSLAQMMLQPPEGDMQVITEPKKEILGAHDCHNRAFIVTVTISVTGTKSVKNGEKLAPGRTEVFTLSCNARTCLQAAEI